jgi:hypothetical protein
MPAHLEKTSERPAEVTPKLTLRVGQLVEVRSAAEILGTLDENGEIEGLPFMPEMVRYCGHQFTVASVAHKTCDTVTRSGMRKMTDAVHLTGAGARCDGSAHDGCQAACLIFWKTAWLKVIDSPVNAVVPSLEASEAAPRLLPLVVLNSRRDPLPDGTERHSCQATEMPRAAPDMLKLLAPKQYVQDIRSGNRGFGQILRSFLVGLFDRAQGLSTKFLPRALRFRGGLPWGFIKGELDKTETYISNLQPGELVRIKTKEQIMRTLDREQRNRGLGFDQEMSRFCGRTARVARRVNRIIDERNGEMLTMKNPCIVLEGIICEGAYHAGCPRAIPPYWREIWLERVAG